MFEQETASRLPVLTLYSPTDRSGVLTCLRGACSRRVFHACFTEWILMGCSGPGVFNSPDKPLFFPPCYHVWSPTAYGGKLLPAACSGKKKKKAFLFDQLLTYLNNLGRGMSAGNSKPAKKVFWGEMRRRVGFARSSGENPAPLVFRAPLRTPKNYPSMWTPTPKVADIFHLQKAFEIILSPK